MTAVSMTLPQLHRCECTVGGNRIHLPPLPCEMLAVLLASHPDRLMTVETLIEALWPNPDFEPEWANKCVHVMAGRLRRVGIMVVGQRGRGGGLFIPREARATDAEPQHRLAA